MKIAFLFLMFTVSSFLCGAQSSFIKPDFNNAYVSSEHIEKRSEPGIVLPKNNKEALQMLSLGIGLIAVPIIVINNIHDPGDGIYFVGVMMVFAGVYSSAIALGTLMDVVKNNRQNTLKASLAIEFENVLLVPTAGLAFHSFPAAAIRFDFYGKHLK